MPAQLSAVAPRLIEDVACQWLPCLTMHDDTMLLPKPRGCLKRRLGIAALFNGFNFCGQNFVGHFYAGHRGPFTHWRVSSLIVRLDRHDGHPLEKSILHDRDKDDSVTALASVISERGLTPRSEMAQPKAAIWTAAALRSTLAPMFSMGRSKGFQRSPTTCS